MRYTVNAHPPSVEGVEAPVGHPTGAASDFAEWDPDALDEPRRIAEHVAEVTPQYRERARAWLNAEHTDMVEELATLLATISAECCP